MSHQKEFAHVKFMGLLSGHGQEKITGKQLPLQVIQKLVLWSWSEEEVTTLSTKLKDAGSSLHLTRPTRCVEDPRGISPDPMKTRTELEKP